MILSLQWMCVTIHAKPHSGPSRSAFVIGPRPQRPRPPQGWLANLLDRPGDRVLDCGDREGGAVSCSNRVSDRDEGVAHLDEGLQQGRIYTRRIMGLAYLPSFYMADTPFIAGRP